MATVSKDVVVQQSPLPCRPAPRLTFLQGVICGQVSFLIVSILFLKYFVFEHRALEHSSAAVGVRESKRKGKRGNRPRKSSVSLNVQAPDILSTLEYDIASHAPESLDWLNVLIAQALSGYRTFVLNSTIGQDGGAKGLLEEALNRKSSSEQLTNEPASSSLLSLDYIEVTDVIVGDKYPVLSDARVRPSGEDGSVRVELDVDFNDHVSLSVSTSLLANFPRPRFAVLPVSLGLTLERFSGTLTVEIPYPALRERATLRGATGPACPPAAPSIHLSLHPDFTLNISTTSLLGSRAKLQDVPKVEQLILARVRGYIQDRVVWPGRVQISLPAVNPSAPHHHHHHHHHHHQYEGPSRTQQPLRDGQPESWEWVSESSPAVSPRSTAPTDLLGSAQSNESTSATPLSSKTPSTSASPPSVNMDAPGGPNIVLHPKVKPSPSVPSGLSATLSSSPPALGAGGSRPPLYSPLAESVPGYFRPSPPLADTLHKPFEPPALSRGGGRGRWVHKGGEADDGRATRTLGDGRRAGATNGSGAPVGGGGVTAARLAEAARLYGDATNGLRYRYGGGSVAGVGVGVEVASSVGSRSRRAF